MDLDGTSWIAVRAFEDIGGGRFRFAHTAPWHIDVEGRPLFPRQEEIGFLINHTQAGLNRNRAYFDAQSIAEYEEALAVYRDIEARKHTTVGTRHQPCSPSREGISVRMVAGGNGSPVRISFPNEGGDAAVTVHSLDGRRVAHWRRAPGTSVVWNPPARAKVMFVAVVETARQRLTREFSVLRE